MSLWNLTSFLLAAVVLIFAAADAWAAWEWPLARSTKSLNWVDPALSAHSAPLVTAPVTSSHLKYNSVSATGLYTALCILRCYFNIINLSFWGESSGTRGRLLASEVLITRMERPLSKFPQKRERGRHKRLPAPIPVRRWQISPTLPSHIGSIFWHRLRDECSRYGVQTEGIVKMTKYWISCARHCMA